jgi:uncharacterized membrane protein
MEAMTSSQFMSIIFSGKAAWRRARWMQVLRNSLGSGATVMVRVKALAPYALIELILPGGSVMALLLWLYRRRRNGVETRVIACL